MEFITEKERHKYRVEIECSDIDDDIIDDLDDIIANLPSADRFEAAMRRRDADCETEQTPSRA
jgi:hypothetical protein